MAIHRREKSIDRPRPWEALAIVTADQAAHTHTDPTTSLRTRRPPATPSPWQRSTSSRSAPAAARDEESRTSISHGIVRHQAGTRIYASTINDAPEEASSDPTRSARPTVDDPDTAAPLGPTSQADKPPTTR